MTAPAAHPPTRSFKPRRRGLSPARAARMDRLAPVWTLPVAGPVLSWAEVFGNDLAVVLDIGFGGGEALIAAADADERRNVVGVEVHTPGISAVLDAIDANGWAHVRVVDGDAIEFLARVPPASLTAVRVYFPDPWPKQKQQHRRLLRAPIVRELAERLVVGGQLCVATDSSGYAKQIVDICAAEPLLAGGVVPRPIDRAVTRYEARAAHAGREAVDMIFRRVPTGGRMRTLQ